ncbi:MAG: peptide chain release factor N(5)-glutamine methyltransferase [Devosia sp.]
MHDVLHLPDPCGEVELQSLYNGVKRAFRDGGLATPELDARLLVTDTLGVTTAQLIANPRQRVAPVLARALVDRARARLEGQSIGRILGRRAFWSLDLRVGPSTLEPRPETETVVELALSVLRDVEAPSLVADLGVGSGAILLAVLSERPNSYGVGLDISFDALAEAARNAGRHGLASRAAFVRSNYGASLAAVFDIVVSNPPYIATDVIAQLDPTVRNCDPLLALDGGKDGLDAYRTVFAQAETMLKPDGRLIVEIDPRAETKVVDEALAHRLGVDHVANDLTGAARAISFRRLNK